MLIHSSIHNSLCNIVQFLKTTYWFSKSGSLSFGKQNKTTCHQNTNGPVWTNALRWGEQHGQSHSRVIFPISASLHPPFCVHHCARTYVVTFPLPALPPPQKKCTQQQQQQLCRVHAQIYTAGGSMIISDWGLSTRGERERKAGGEREFSMSILISDEGWLMFFGEGYILKSHNRIVLNWYSHVYVQDVCPCVCVCEIRQCGFLWKVESLICWRLFQN